MSWILAVLAGGAWGLLTGALSRPRWRALPPSLLGATPRAAALRHVLFGLAVGTFLVGIAMLAAAFAATTGISNAAYHAVWLPFSLLAAFVVVLAWIARAGTRLTPLQVILPHLLSALSIAAVVAAALLALTLLLANWNPGIP